MTMSICQNFPLCIANPSTLYGCRRKVTLSILRVTSLSDMPCTEHSLVVLYPINLFVPSIFHWKSAKNSCCEWIQHCLVSFIRQIWCWTRGITRIMYATERDRVDRAPTVMVVHLIPVQTMIVSVNIGFHLINSLEFFTSQQQHKIGVTKSDRCIAFCYH